MDVNRDENTGCLHPESFNIQKHLFQVQLFCVKLTKFGNKLN